MSDLTRVWVAGLRVSSSVRELPHRHISSPDTVHLMRDQVRNLLSQTTRRSPIPRRLALLFWLFVAACQESSTPTPNVVDASASDAISSNDPPPSTPLQDGAIYGEVDTSKLGKMCKQSAECGPTAGCVHFPNVGYRCCENGMECKALTCPPGMVCNGTLRDPGAVFCR